MTQPTVSHHLRVLRQAGLVDNKKMCRDVFYWVDPEQAEIVLTHLASVFQIRESGGSQDRAEPQLSQSKPEIRS